MSDSDEYDIDKWMAPATSGEVAQGLLHCRLALHAIAKLITAAKKNDPKAVSDAFDNFENQDKRLKQLINDIGGLNGKGD